MAERDRLLVPGRTCWRIERANRLALIVDAADYFRLAKAAMLKAQHSIMLIGWDFDTRIKFEPEAPTLNGPNRLGALLSWLPKHRPGLRIFLLKWDLGLLQAVGRGMTPLFILNFMTGKRLRLKLDGVHPVGAAHHQKIIVIDDALAFCGGIDMTVDRWDTREHRDGDARRTKPNGQAYAPWHDATTAIDGAAACALGDLARERWRQATGEQLPLSPNAPDLWPDGLKPTIERVDVAIARTIPRLDERAEVQEIENLYLGAIGGAKQAIYLESQYLASRTLAEALARRLAEADGPEVVIVLPETADGWLEREAMDGARQKLLYMLWRADRHKHLGVYYPVTKSGTGIYVHAKIMVVDDWLVRVGSSNLNNRSMGFDTECDLAVEATPDALNAAQVRDVIRSIRSGLLCEHLGVAPGAFASAMDAASGSLLKAVEALRGPGRTLKAFQPADIADDASVLAENELVDPERPPASLMQRFTRSLSELACRIVPGQR